VSTRNEVVAGEAKFQESSNGYPRQNINGPFGSKKHRTPNLDRMAAEGRVVTSFYVTSSICSPSRSSLMTGCYPRRIGLHENEKQDWVLFSDNQRGLNASEVTVAEVPKQKDQATAIVGTSHLGDQPEFLPTRQGFDSYLGIPYSNDMGHDSRPKPYRHPPLPLFRDETVIEEEPDQRYLTRHYTEEAIEFINANKDRPFFWYLPHTMPHWPQYSSEDSAGKSANVGKPGHVENAGPQASRLSCAHVGQTGLTSVQGRFAGPGQSIWILSAGNCPL
jgi:arylsulfatase A